jgi:hypothetical protein
MKLIPGLVVAGLIIAGGTHAKAQTADAHTPVKGAPRVIVTDRSGEETIGRLVSWSPAAIIIKSRDAEYTYPSNDVVRVDLRDDSLRNGFLIGVVLGALPWIIGGCDCTGPQTIGMLAGIAVYGAVGAGIDALIPGRSPLWTSAVSSKSSRGFAFGFSPRDRRAVLRWRAL